MFCGWSLPIPNKPITGPREPLVITFPSCSVTSPHDPTFSRGVYNLFKQIKKLPDITPEHLECLNVEVEYDVPLERLVPSPPSSAPSAPATVDGSATTSGSSAVPASDSELATCYLPLGDGDEMKNQTYAERRKELLVPNEAAFEVLARTRRDVKLGHFYRFFQSLELVNAHYGLEGNAHSGMPEKFREDLVKNFVEPLCWGYNARVLAPRSPPKVQYQTSRFATRIDLFAYINPELAAERKAGIVEGPLFGIQCRHEEYFVTPGGSHCQDSPPDSPEEPAGEGSKSSKTDNEGDTPMNEGPPEPVAGAAEPEPKPKPVGATVVVVPEVVESEEDGNEKAGTTDSAAEQKKQERLEQKAEEARRKAAKREEERKVRMKKGGWPEGDVWDVLKEVGALLCVAQERRKGGRGDGGIGKGNVEKKVRYRGIGRDGPWWDNVFVLSSVHSHISFSRVHISGAYLRFLETGKLPNPEHELIKDAESGWSEFRILKTKWFNLMKPEEREEAARAVCGVLGYLTRNE